MTDKDLTTQLTELLEPLAIENGFELVAVEIAGADHQPIVRVFLDKDGGIDLDAVAASNEWVSAALEDHDGLSGPFVLEVSSPGIERPLRTLDHFKRFIGSDAKIKTSRPLESRSAFTGTIASVEGDEVVLESDGDTYRIPMDAIRKARLKVDIDFGNDKGVPR